MALDVAAGVTVYAAGSGFVRLVDVRALVECARRHDVLVRLDVRPGDLVVARSPMATVRAREPEPEAGRPGPEADEVTAGINAAVTFGYERTLDQDVAFGFRQLEDIAVRPCRRAPTTPSPRAPPWDTWPTSSPGSPAAGSVRLLETARVSMAQRRCARG